MNQMIFIFLFAGFQSLETSAQQDSLVLTVTPISDSSKDHSEVYHIKPWIDIPATIVLDGWSLYGMGIIYGRDAVPESEILALNKNDINRFDRPITENYSLKAKSLSDQFFYGSMPLPLLLLLDKKIRKDGLKIGLLFLETMGTTGALYT